MSKLMLLLGNGFTIDLISQIRKDTVVNTSNLFTNGDIVEWPDGTKECGFLSYKHCKNLWNLGARPGMNYDDASELIEDIISCANTLTKTMMTNNKDNVYINAYYELAAYLKHLFIMYNDMISDEDLQGVEVNNWGWYDLINKANRNSDIEEIVIITYNYDIFLERILKLHNINFDIMGIEEGGNKIKIFKPHGSISFCYKGQGEQETFDIRRDADMYEAQLLDFNVKYVDLNENYYVNAMIPPSGDSSRMTFKWAEEIREKILKKLKEIEREDRLVVSGLSYWHVDRKEIDEILVKLPTELNVYMVNPFPPRALNAVISCIFEKYILYSNSKNIGGLL